MRVKIVNSGKIADVNESYGIRLIEHGIAVLVKPEPKQEKKPVGKKKQEG